MLKTFPSILYKVIIVRATPFLIVQGIDTFFLFPFFLFSPISLFNILYILILHILGIVPRLNSWANIIIESLMFYLVMYLVGKHLGGNTSPEELGVFSKFALMLLAAPLSIIAYMLTDAFKVRLCAKSSAYKDVPSKKDTYKINALSRLNVPKMKESFKALSKVLSSFLIIGAILLADEYRFEQTLDRNNQLFALCATLICFIPHQHPVSALNESLPEAEHSEKEACVP